MSRLRELRLHGFKSFADQTRFVFEPGVNAVIGPNGSGKSNMADAVRWVLGEQSNRSLRTRRSDDVIFAGSEQRKPQGMAEAVLTLDNADGWLPIDFAEVSIGRRSYRSGDSEYLINGARARLRDVVELLGEGRLGANELVVVGQGTVDAALSLRPEERRQLFEEAAGVKGLQVRRNEAMSRLAKALDNLSRVSDIVGELKPQVRRLALQAEHQQQHDALGARARALVSASHQRRERTARAALGEARREAAAAEAALAAFRESEESGRRAIAEAERRYWEAEEFARATTTERERTREAVIRSEGRLEAVVARIAELEASIDREQAELADAERALAELADGTADAAVAPALADATAAEDAWRAAVAELAAADEALLAAEDAVAVVRSRESDRIAAAARASEEATRRQARHEQATRELEAARSEAQQAEAALRTASEAAAEARARSAQAATAFDGATAERDAAQAEADRAAHAVVEIGERLRAVRAELEAISEPHDASSRLGRRLSEAGWPTLLDGLHAPEEAWPAIEAVVGGELEGALLWSSDDPTSSMTDARGAARLLASSGDSDAGSRGEALRAIGADRTLAEWVGTAAAPLVFHRTVVASDVGALLAGWRALPPGWSAVTPDGDLADERGVVLLRGRADPAGGAAVRAHARRRELSDALRDLERRNTDAQAAAHAATERLRRAREQHLSARDAAEAADGADRRARGELDAAQARAERSTRRGTELETELANLAPGPGQSRAQDEPSADLAKLQARADAARAERDRVATRRDERRATWTAARQAAEAAETRTADGRRQRALREARVAQLSAGLPARRDALERLADERSEVAAALAAAREADGAVQDRATSAESARGERRRELLDLERDRGGIGARLGELERRAQATAIEASRRDEALASLAREHELALEGLPETDAEAPMDEIDALDDESVESELRRVRRTLAQVGSVNPFAVEEHRELSGRLEEMTSQEQDLREAIASTQELIATLDGEIAGQFDAAFRAIAEKFDEFCRLLFAGGSGSLQMADEADGDAPGGIEIVVRPPGKRLQRLAMLSGGERALTGVALLFAMLTVNPVPFCILDEVDAALDEANIGRFAQALRKLSESIDFVVITHNRATIEVADTIYGVTMTDAAVSRVLSLRLADVPVEVGA
ncbi:MAG TPA: chromosome segregation protein SMC [Candidatus Angelobacter sp.]|nr:chromosome segregation protein SMC [Candidatus Angelobacter sp.]